MLNSINYDLNDLTAHLQSENSWLSLLLSQMPSGISIAEAPSGKLLYHNEQAIKILRHPMLESDSYLGYAEYGAHHDEYTPYTPEEYPIARALKGEAVFGEEMYYRRGDGTWTYFLVNAGPIKDASGKVIAAISTFDDIGEKKHLEAETLERKRILEALMEFTPEGIAIADKDDFRLKMVSRYIIDKIGELPEGATTEQVRQRWKVYYPDGTEIPPQELPLVRAITTGEVIKNVELVQVNSEGKPLHLICNAAPIYSASGEITGGVITWRDITETRHLEEEILKREQRYTSLFNTKANGIVHFKVITNGNNEPVNLRFMQVNNAYEDIIKKKRGDVEGKLLTEVFPGIENAPQNYIKNYGNIGLHGGELVYEDYFEISSIWVSNYIFRAIPGEVVVIFSDISGRKNTEQALAHERELLQSIIDNIPVMITVYDSNLNFFRLNKEFVQVLGWTEEDAAKGREFLTSLYPETHDEAIRYMLSLESGWREFSVYSKSGDCIETSWANIRLPDGTQIGIGIDLRKRKEADLKLRQSEGKLREAQKLAHIGSFSVRPGAAEAEWSEEMFHIFERDLKEGNPTVAEIIDMVHKDDLEKVLETISIAENEKKKTQTEYRIVLPGGRIKYLHNIFNPAFDDSGTQVNLFGTTMDITERKLTEIEIQKVMDELRRSNKELEQFAYTASHDLQEPIRMIKSYAQLLRYTQEKVLGNNAKEFLGFIEEGASRMQILVNDLLSYSRIITGKTPYEYIDTKKLVNDVLDDLRIKIEEEQADIRVKNMPVIRGDKTQIRQLFQNLIQNSLKFRGKEDPEIIITCKPESDYWLFSIRDNGIGIDPRFHSRVFQIFQRLHTREQYPGTGIGLALCSKIVERHGGNIWIESEAGKGAAFYFKIPK